MKKIMKKALSLLVVVAMICASMTVMAATGDYVEIPSLEYCIYSGDTVTVAANTTTYYEIGTEGVSGTYEFVVEGTGAFDVAVCGEGIANGHPDGYSEGTAISAIDGRVETDITSYESTYGYACFSITNNTNENVDYTCTIVFPEGTQGNPKAVTLALDGTAQVTVPAGGQYYIDAKVPNAGVEYQLNITGNTGFGYSSGWGMPLWDTNGVCTTTIAAYNPGAIVTFAIANQTGSNITCTLSIAEVIKELGDESNPDALPMDTTTSITLVGNEYWYTWTAPESGTLTITIDNSQCADGWTYKAVCGDSTQHFSTGWDESDKNKYEITVVAGDVVDYGVSVPSFYGESIGYDVYTYSNGTVVFTTEFVAGEVTPGGSEGGSGEGGSGEGNENTDGVEINENFYHKYQELTEGSNDIMPMFGYPTTLYTFFPTEAGEYLVTIDEAGATLGYYGSNEWFPFDYTENKASTLTLEAQQANAPMLIGVSDAMLATVTITKVGELDDEGGYDEIEYENVVTPEDFTFPGNSETILDSYVDTEDSVADTAVLGDDGYYHLNSANGPVLFADLSDSRLSLVDAQSYGQLSAVNYENGVPVSVTDFYNAFDKYIACADTESVTDATLYPLTEDLIAIFKLVGEDKGWYGEYGYLGGTEEDAWMFACYYDEAITSLAPSTGGEGGTTGGATTDGTTSNNNSSSSTVTTGDNANAFVCVAVMMVGLAAVAVVLKKRAR